MAIEKKVKKDVWKKIFRLIVPHKKKFLWVVTLGLLSTGASLIEPLIYREAINDVAGLFVKQAKENAQKDLGLDPGDVEDIHSMVEEETDTATAEMTTPSGGAASGATVTKPVTPAPGAHGHAATAHTTSKKGHTKKAAVKPPEPHTQTHVAARSPEQALSTLLWAVVWLFVINLVSTLLWRVGREYASIRGSPA